MRTRRWLDLKIARRRPNLNLTKWPLLALFAACCSASAADLFFVVGQADPRWHSRQEGAAAPADVKLVIWTVGSKFTSLASQLCKTKCADANPLDGVVPSFANTWTALSKNPAHFVIYRKADAALTQGGAQDKRYWTDFEARTGIYQDALTEFRLAQQSAGFGAPEGIKRRYLIWVQNETDALADISAVDYKASLIALFDRFNKDLGAGGKSFDAMFIVSSGPVRETPAVAGEITAKPDTAYRAKVNLIVQAQDSAAAQGKIVMVSRSMRSSLPGCAGNMSHTGCATKDLLRYHSWLNEALGAEMARNAFTYHSNGIKPLLPASCKQEPASCAGTADVYRWVAKLDSTSQPIYGTDPDEFDEATHHGGRMRFALFPDSAPGRIPLYRSSVAGGYGLSTEPDSTKANVLGYCYAAPRGNANVKLVAMREAGLTTLAREPIELSQVSAVSQGGDKTLCYVN
jgi:hypothetical protein